MFAAARESTADISASVSSWARPSEEERNLIGLISHTLAEKASLKQCYCVVICHIGICTRDTIIALKQKKSDLYSTSPLTDYIYTSNLFYKSNLDQLTGSQSLQKWYDIESASRWEFWVQIKWVASVEVKVLEVYEATVNSLWIQWVVQMFCFATRIWHTTVISAQQANFPSC